MFGITSRGDHKKTNDYLKKLHNKDIFSDLDSYGQLGVDALSRATPVDSGLTASSWEYRIIKNSIRPGIEWYNTNIVDGTSIAILIQYGHGTGTGGYVEGRDYINPAMQVVFDNIAEDIWKKVNS